MKKKIFVVSICFFFLSSPLIYADLFEDLGLGARPLGMSGAYTSISDDLNGIYYNPAGLIFLKNPQVSVMYAQLFWGLTDGSSLGDAFVSYGQPLPKNLGSIGVAWFMRSLTNYYSENTIYVSYAYNVIRNLSIGISLKPRVVTYGSDAYTAIDPVFIRNGYSKTGFGLDAGAIYKGIRNLSLGISLQDVTQPDMGLDTQAIMPMNIKVGGSYDLVGFAVPLPKGKEFKIENFLLSLDASLQAQYYKVNCGLETWFMEKTFALRGGYGIGNYNYTNISVGASYLITQISPALQIDYAFLYNLGGASSGTAGDHRFSLTLKFGEGEKAKLFKPVEKKPSEEEELKKLEEELKKLEE